MELLCHVLNYLRLQFPLVAFQGEHIVAAGGDDLIRELLLSSSRNDGDDGLFEFDLGQNRRNCRDFIPHLRCCHLRQAKAVLTRPNRNRVQRLQAAEAIMGER